MHCARCVAAGAGHLDEKPASLTLLALWPWASSPISLSFYFFICKVGMKSNTSPALVQGHISGYTLSAEKSTWSTCTECIHCCYYY